MIKHIVMFKLKDTGERSAYENAIEAKRRFDAVIAGVPVMKRGEAVVNSSDAPESNFTLALICDFETIDDLNAYQVHPVHKEFAGFIASVKTDRACIDYEY